MAGRVSADLSTAAHLRVRVAQLEGELQHAHEQAALARDEAARARHSAEQAWQFAKAIARAPNR